MGYMGPQDFYRMSILRYFLQPQRKGNTDHLSVANDGARVKDSAGRGADDRSVTLDTVELQIRAEAPVKKWCRFVETTRMVPLPGAGPGRGARDYAAYFYALPDPRSDSPLYLYGELRPDPEDAKHADLKLRWELRPEAAPPPWIQRASRRVGGSAVLARIADSWPGGRTVSADVIATFAVDMRVIRPHSKLGLRAGLSEVSGFKLTQTGVVWRLDPPNGPVSRLWVARGREDMLVLGGSGSHSLTLGPDMEAAVVDAVRAGVQPFLRAR